MPDTSPTAFDRATALTTAQQRAYEHAMAAQKHHAQALKETEYADARNGNDYQRAAVSEARQRAQGHAARTAESARLAEMWARVATALTASADGQAATYDLNVQLDPKDVGKELARHVQQLRGTGSPESH